MSSLFSLSSPLCTSLIAISQLFSYKTSGIRVQQLQTKKKGEKQTEMQKAAKNSKSIAMLCSWAAKAIPNPVFPKYQFEVNSVSRLDTNMLSDTFHIMTSVMLGISLLLAWYQYITVLLSKHRNQHHNVVNAHGTFTKHNVSSQEIIWCSPCDMWLSSSWGRIKLQTKTNKVKRQLMFLTIMTNSIGT